MRVYKPLSSSPNITSIQSLTGDNCIQSSNSRANMKTSHVLALCLVAALVLGYSSVIEAAEGDYDYSNGPNGPANWGNLPGAGVCATGNTQSPMVITTDNTVSSNSLDKNLKSVIPQRPLSATITNTGKTIEVAVKGIRLTIDGVTYESAQFHIHYPSEHTIFGTRFPLELHLVHIEPGTGKIAVIGWLFKLGKASPFLEPFWGNLPKSGEEYPIAPIRFSLSSKGPYGRYDGSLTTPPCSEAVVWTLMLQYPTVSAEQLELLKIALPKENARPLQPANGRAFLLSK